MSEQKRYTAQEMREQAAEYAKLLGDDSDTAAMLRQAADTEEEMKNLVEQNEKLNAWANELLSEREQARARLEAVVKMASESHISREVKNIGLRLYVEIDDFKMDLDMGEVVKSLNSIDAILRAARGEGGAK